MTATDFDAPDTAVIIFDEEFANRLHATLVHGVIVAMEHGLALGALTLEIFLMVADLYLLLITDGGDSWALHYFGHGDQVTSTDDLSILLLICCLYNLFNDTLDIIEVDPSKIITHTPRSHTLDKSLIHISEPTRPY